MSAVSPHVVDSGEALAEQPLRFRSRQGRQEKHLPGDAARLAEELLRLAGAEARELRGLSK